MNRKLLLGIALFTCFGQSTVRLQAEEPFYLHEGDRVVFYGDSITEQRAYTNFVETFVRTRFPKLKVDFINSGWGGDRVGGGGGGPIELRLQRDVIAYKPTVMTIMLGMNDGGYAPFSQGTFDAYSQGYLNILDKVTEAIPGIRLTLIQPSPYDDITQPPKFDGGYNEVLLKFSEFIKQTADDRHLNVADFNSPVNALMTKANAADQAAAKTVLPDRVHPSSVGHLIMAEALLKAWNAPSIVTNVEIDVAKGAVTKEEFTKVSGLNAGNIVSWTQLDERLPFPVSPGEAVAINYSDFTEALNRQILKVTGLPKKAYILRIDGSRVANFTAEQLAKGINLALISTPMQKQAATVAGLTAQHVEKHFFRWRTLQVPMENENEPELTSEIPKILAVYDRKEQVITDQQIAAAQPVEHTYELEVLDAGTTNLALNMTFVSSDPNPFGWDRGLTDGEWTEDAHTYASGSTPQFPKTVTIDLLSASQLAKVVVGVPAFGSTKTITVSLSEDGKTYNEVGSHEFNQRAEDQFNYEFPPQSARYIRLTYPDHYEEEAGYDPNYVFTSEVEAYGPVEK